MLRYCVAVECKLMKQPDPPAKIDLLAAKFEASGIAELRLTGTDFELLLRRGQKPMLTGAADPLREPSK